MLHDELADPVCVALCLANQKDIVGVAGKTGGGSGETQIELVARRICKKQRETIALRYSMCQWAKQPKFVAIYTKCTPGFE